MSLLNILCSSNSRKQVEVLHLSADHLADAQVKDGWSYERLPEVTKPMIGVVNSQVLPLKSCQV